MNNGYDKFLEFQYHQTGDFYNSLFETIARADMHNLQRLAKGFPQEVAAYRLWVYTESGVEEFCKRVSQDHPLLIRLMQEYNIHDPNSIHLRFEASYPNGNGVRSTIKGKL